MGLLSELNEAQRAATIADDEPLLIVAGPGTGKTKTLSARIAHLVESGRARPQEIVALTFTNKAARELRERVSALLSGAHTVPAVTTFHALGRELLKQRGGLKPLATSQQLSEIIQELKKPADLKRVSAHELMLIISRAKTELRAPADDAVVKLLAQYEAALATRGLQDFDDLLHKTYEQLQKYPELRPHYRYVLVDEFQDTSELQYELLKLLGDTSTLCVIGDPNQSIYAFRGAGTRMFDRFRADFPTAKAINLTVNYRSRPEIVALANAIFPDSPQLVPHEMHKGTVQAVQTLNEYSEAALIVREIEQGIGGSDFLHAHADTPARQPRDYAVIYRTHRVAKALQRAFAESGIPCQIVGEGSPYEKPSVQAVIAALRFLLHPDEAPLPLVKTLKPEEVRIILQTMRGAKSAGLCDVASVFAEALGVMDDPALPQLYSTLVQFGAYETGLPVALEHLDRIAESEFYDPSLNTVTLLTIHASKGLEFEHVFVVAAEEGILPKLSKTKGSDIAEEKRLFYVAATRAKERLDVLYTKTRGGEPAQVSRFVAALPRKLDPELPTLEKRACKRVQRRAQTSLF